MKREEILNEINRRIDELYDARSHAKAFESKAAYTDQISVLASLCQWVKINLPANSITLQLPVYAAGDPKAGEVVRRYDVIFDDQGECDMDSFIGVLARPDGSTAYLMESVEGFEGPLYTQKMPMLFYSTAAARDAAMKAAEEAAK